MQRYGNLCNFVPTAGGNFCGLVYSSPVMWEDMSLDSGIRKFTYECR